MVGTPCTRTVSIYNRGNEPLHLQNIATDCPCTKVLVDNRNIAENDSTSLHITLETNCKLGLTDNKEDITLYRKYLLRNIWINRWAEIIGTKIETSNDRNFNTKPVVLYQFKNLPTSETCRITLNRQLKDYLRIVPSKGIFPVFAEIKLFDANHVEIKDNLYNIYAIGNSLTGDTIVTRKLHDNNLKTTFYKRFPFWIGINIRKIKDKVSYIQLTMWNDENQIIRGHDYELFYYDKNKWNSLGKQRASKDCLLYQNVPKNSLLLLRDYSEGKEERIFMYKHNKQIWY